MTFWPALKEAVLEMIFGRYALQCWCQEELRRKECEQFQQEQYKKSQLL